MPDNENYLELADFTGLLIDNTLSALIKSLESQVQWREQISALDRMTDEEILSSLSPSDITDWLEETDVSLIALFEKWQALDSKGQINLKADPDLENSLLGILNEIGAVAPASFNKDKILMAADFPAVIEEIKAHLMTAAKRRLSMMKEMGLPTLVAERVEIKSRMNLLSSARPPIADEAAKTVAAGKAKAAKKSQTAKKAKAELKAAAKAGPAPGRQIAHKIGAPVKAQIVGKLTDLEKIRERIAATQSHSINITASPTAENSDAQSVNAEISITLRSHFF